MTNPTGMKVVAWLDRFGELFKHQDHFESLESDVPLVTLADSKAFIADALRYRWLREHFRFANDSMCELWFDASLDPNDSGVPADLDQSIDAALSKLGEKGNE